MKHKYTITLELSMGDLLSEINDFETSINESMKGFGFDEKMYITSQLPLELTVNQKMTDAQKQQMEGLIHKTYAETFKHVRVLSFVYNGIA